MPTSHKRKDNLPPSDKNASNKNLLGGMRVNSKKKIQQVALMEELRLNDLSEAEKEFVDRLLVVMSRFCMRLS